MRQLTDARFSTVNFQPILDAASNGQWPPRDQVFVILGANAVESALPEDPNLRALALAPDLYVGKGVTITGRFRGVNFPLRRTVTGPFVPDFRAVIETTDGATIMFECHGYGRTYPPGRREIVGSVLHMSDDDRYRRLNDVVCMCTGEVRAPADPGQQSSDLVMDVAELVWEPIPE